MKGLNAIHEMDIAHLNIRIDNVLMNVPLNDTAADTEESLLQLKIENFGIA